MDTHGKVQVIDHLTDQRELLVVLLAEERVRGTGQREQLRHHREHAREVRRPGRALQHPAERTGLDRRARAVRVHRLGGRREDSVYAFCLKLGDVLGQRPRIRLQVLARRELQRVDKDADHHGIAQRFGGADEGEVAAMKRAHGGHERDGAGRKRRSQRFRSVHELGHTPIIYPAPGWAGVMSNSGRPQGALQATTLQQGPYRRRQGPSRRSVPYHTHA